MLRTTPLANPSAVKQAPDALALNRSTTVFIESLPLATAPTAQNYFEPGINHRLIRRAKPKTDYTLPSDMPKFPVGFVPVNKPQVGLGEEPSIQAPKELIPADLMTVFQKIAEEDKEKDKLVNARLDLGTRTTRAYQKALKKANRERKVESMVKEGFTEEEANKALNVLREEEALAKAKLPAPPMTIEEAMREAFGMGPANEEPTAP